MNECPQTRDMCRQLEALGAMTYPLQANQFAPAGWPDRYICHPVWHGHLEFKGANTDLTIKQIHVMKELNARQPGCAFVVRDTGLIAGQIELPESGRIVLATFENAAGLLVALADLSNRPVNTALRALIDKHHARYQRKDRT